MSVTHSSSGIVEPAWGDAHGAAESILKLSCDSRVTVEARVETQDAANRMLFHDRQM